LRCRGTVWVVEEALDHIARLGPSSFFFGQVSQGIAVVGAVSKEDRAIVRVLLHRFCHPDTVGLPCCQIKADWPAVGVAFMFASSITRPRDRRLSDRMTVWEVTPTSFRKTGLAVAVNEMLKRRRVAEWLRRGPVAGCEMRVADEEEFDLCARLVEPAELRKACRQEAA